MSEEKITLTPEQLEELSGGSLRHAEGGFEVFDSSTGKSYGIYEDYTDAVNVAKKNRISAMGTWGDSEVPWGLLGTGLNRQDVRLREDRDHEPDKVYGTGSFDD